MRDHLLSAYKQTGIMPEQLANVPELPESPAHVWAYFTQLHKYRGSNGFGAERITPTGIKDWCWLTGTILESWEIRALQLIDDEYIASNSKES